MRNTLLRYLSGLRKRKSHSRRTFAGVASYNDRHLHLEQTFISIVGQVDRIGVYLNNYTFIPDFLRHPKVILKTSNDLGDLKDNGKFAFLNEATTDLYFGLDDDIIYPPDYVTKMTRYLSSLGLEHAACVHGSLYPCPVIRLTSNRKVFHFRQSSPFFTPVQVAGTGTVAFDQSIWKLSLDEFKDVGMADVWFSRAADQRMRRIYCVKRDRNWLQPIPSKTGNDDLEESALYDAARHNDERQVELLNRNTWLFNPAEVLVEGIATNKFLLSRLSLTQALECRDLLQMLGEPSLDELRAKNASTLMGATAYERLLIGANKSTRKSDKSSLLKIILSDLPVDDLVSIVDKLDSVQDQRDLGLASNLPIGTRYDLAPQRLPNTKRRLLNLVLDSTSAEAKTVPDSLASLDWVDGSQLLRVNPSMDLESLIEDARFDSLQKRHQARAFEALFAAIREQEFSIRVSPMVAETLSDLARHPSLSRRILALCEARTQSADIFLEQSMWWFIEDPLDGELALFLSLLRSFTEGVGLTESLNLINTQIRQALIPISPHLANLVESQKLDCSPVSGHWIHSIRDHSHVLGSESEAAGVAPRLSVIMSVGEHSELFEAALQSLMLSQGVEIEIIVVWDGVKQQVPDSGVSSGVSIKHLESRDRIGPYACRNLALPHCAGDFIAFHDADDWTHPMRLAIQVALVREQRLVSCTVSQIRLFADGCPDLENNGGVMGDGPVTLVVRREVFEELGGFDPVRTRGDIEFIRRLKAFYGPSACAHFRLPLLFASSSRTTNSKRFSESALKMYRKQMNVWHEEIRRGRSPYLDPLRPYTRQFIAPSSLLVTHEDTGKHV